MRSHEITHGFVRISDKWNLKSLQGMSLAYLSSLLTLIPYGGLCSDEQMLLVVTKPKLINYGDRAFHMLPQSCGMHFQSTSDDVNL